MIFVLCGVLAACGASDAEVRRAKQSGYQADFATVYGEALAAVADLYPQLREDAVTGVIKTAWHPIRIHQTAGGEGNQTLTNDPNNPTGMGTGVNQVNADRRSYYIRFEVRVVGGKPWRVSVHGEASEVRAGDVPAPLRGAEVPHWLAGREDSLRVSIHERLKKHAVKLAEEKPVSAKVSRSQRSFGKLPREVHVAIEAVHRAAVARDGAALRAGMAEDFVWASGEAPSADIALAMWQADSARLSVLVRILEAGCQLQETSEVSCPGDGGQGGRVVFEKRASKWLMTSFVSGN